jgi:inorganic phosphate transporter, PiT family
MSLEAADAQSIMPGDKPREIDQSRSVRVRKILQELLIVGSTGIAGTLVLFVLHRLNVDIIVPVGIVLMGMLAYYNGANDVSKAIATLVGSGVTQYRPAIVYGSLCTLVGASISTVVAAGLVATFTKGLIAASTGLTESFALAAILGALAWIYFATRLALPVSTTHAITGAVVTTGVFAFGMHAVLWTNLVAKIIVPLLFSPLIAFVVGLVLFWGISLLLPRVNLDGLHWLSSGFASFTRGLNDAPKIVALGAGFFLIHGKYGTTPLWLFFVVALAMGLGSVLGGLKVTQTLAERVTKMDHKEGFAANLTTALLVGLSSPLSLPVSTTHVSSCAIIGIGMHKGTKNIRWQTVWEMVLAWIVTLPAAGIFGGLAYILLSLSVR